MKVIAFVLALAACSANDDLPAPRISSVAPSHATPGTIVAIAGAYFCHQPADADPLACKNVGSVYFGQLVANVSQYTDSAVMAEVPGGTGVVPVTVAVLGETSNAISFTIE